MPSERSEHHATRQALVEVYDYISPGTNEGISFLVSRLTDDMFTDSFLGGGDISLFTAGGTRGVIKSNTGTTAQMFDPGGGAPASFPIELTREIARLKDILTHESTLLEVIKRELKEIQERYGDARRT